MYIYNYTQRNIGPVLFQSLCYVQQANLRLNEFKTLCLNYCVNKKEYIYQTTVFEQNQDGTNTENKNIG